MAFAEQGGGRRPHRKRLAAALGVASALVAGPLLAQPVLRVTPSLSGELTYTNNVDLLPSGERRGDLVLTLTPSLQIDHDTPRTLLRGHVSLPTVLYARTGEANNRVLPQADVLGRIAVVRDFFFVEAAANVQQTYYDPFGARPEGLINDTDNRYTAGSYRISPYIEGVVGNEVFYRLRNDNIWSNLDSGPIESQRVYTNRLIGTLDRPPRNFGWGLDIVRTETDFPDQPRSHLMELARARLVYQPDPQLQVSVSGGFERNQFPLAEFDGATYGAGVRLRPTGRTLLDVAWEHRFFGESYRVLVEHRMPRWVWSIRASRDITSYPEQLARLPVGSFVPGILNEIFMSRIPDRIERARYILNYMSDRGLPLFLSSPLALYAQQIYLQDYASVTNGILGVRNSIFVTVYRAKTEPLEGSAEALLPALSNLSSNEQIGTTAVWTYALTPTSSLTLTGNASRTEANPPFSRQSDQWSLRLSITRPISPRTTAFAGARYQALDSDLQASYREAAVFIGASHTFR